MSHSLGFIYTYFYFTSQFKFTFQGKQKPRYYTGQFVCSKAECRYTGVKWFFLKVKPQLSEPRFPVYAGSSLISRNARANSVPKALQRRTDRGGACLAVSVVGLMSSGAGAFLLLSGKRGATSAGKLQVPQRLPRSRPCCRKAPKFKA